MRRFSLALVSLLVLAACSKSSAPAAPADAGFTYAPTPTSPPLPSAATSAPTPPAVVDASTTKKPAAEENDFEDQFAYGEYDAGAGDPSMLAKRPGYVSYMNGRFGFSLDAPKALTAMPEPDNGDGLQWRLGNLVAMTASGMNWMPELGLSCASSKNVVAHTATKTSCWATGKRDGMIYWEKQVVARDVLFSLRFEYAESLKAQMDPIVTHVSSSWSY